MTPGPRDTAPLAHAEQISAYRRMSAERRAELAFGLSDAVRRLARDGIRMRHPDYTDADVAQALVSLLYGADTARKVWPELEPKAP